MSQFLLFVEINNKNYPIHEFRNLEEINESTNDIEHKLKLIKFKTKDSKFQSKVVKLNITEKINKAKQIILPHNLRITNPDQKICVKKSRKFSGKMLIKIQMRIKNK